MDHTGQDVLLMQKAGRRVAGFWKNSRIPFLASLIFGLLAYTFAFTNKLLNHDEVSQLFAKGATVTSGRWGLGFLDVLLPNYSMPWIYGILTVALIALAVCILVGLFAIRSRLIQVLLAGTIVVFPSLIGLFGYMFTSSGYAVAFFCAVAAVWCVRHASLGHALAGLMLLGFCLSIYQGYLSVAAGLLVVLLVYDLLLGADARAVLRRGIWYVAFLLAALAGYYIATQVLLRLLGLGFNEYAQGAVTFSLGDIPGRIGIAYAAFAAFFTRGLHAMVPTPLSRGAHLVLFAACAVLLLLWLKKQKKADAGRAALLLVLLALLPLAINCMYLITSPESIHTLVLYGFICLYVLAAVLLDAFLEAPEAVRMQERLRRAALDLGVAVLALVVIINTYVANQAYLNLNLRYENAHSFYTALLADLRRDPQFQEGTKLAVVGSYDSPDFYDQQFPFLAELEGVKGFLPDSYSYGYFLEYYIGLPLPIASAEEVAQITGTEAYASMPSYPYHGSTQIIDGIFVVKLS